ncbi:baseplate assembly protein [Veronia pacifica]|uniref:Uncharacterized protein n=1 Tax=Veronia pacifica TaxID=1080227 RepID=A0A1C3EBK2_9GAMM|nr:baseplate J/gp47 family protein [Veronia pacifica]ODA30623.1 hypothetical protein A8L45_19655 [Veronia pacifica]
MPDINIARLPAPHLVKPVDYRDTVDALADKAQLDNLTPADPAYRVALAAAYREILLRQDANEMCLGMTLAFARGDALDLLAENYYRDEQQRPITRLKNPHTGEQETDDDFRTRLQLSPEGISVAGPDGAYHFHALASDSDVKDACAFGPHSDDFPTAPGTVDLVVLSHQHNGKASDDLLNTVEQYLYPRRPMTVKLNVRQATLKTFAIQARLTLTAVPSPDAVIKAAYARCQQYLDEQHRLGGKVVRSKVDWALQVPGVDEVELQGFKDIRCERHAAPYCTGLTVEIVT